MEFIKKNMQLIAVSVGHFTNDFYMALIPPILFLFTEELSLSLTQQAVIASAITLSGTFLQPIIGYFLDRVGKTSLLIFGIVWVSIGMSITGFITNFYLLVIVISVAGIASSVYHPLGSAVAASLSEGSQGKSLSIFMTIGGFATTFTPLIAVPLATQYGLRSLAFLMIPGIFIAYFLKKSKIDEIKYLSKKNELDKKLKVKLQKNNIIWLSLVVGIAVVKILVTRVMLVFGVQILNLKGIELITAGIILSVHLFVRSVGTFTGGYLSDRYGEKKIMVVFNALTLIAFLCVTFTSGIVSVIGFVLMGYTLNATSTANITMTHKIVPENITFGNGMIMGFASTVAGLLILLFGKIADNIGLLDASRFFNVLMILVIIVSVLLPKKFSD
ncbi:MAG: MFS transporter [Clostridiales bacterium]|nr:MFS transporter [Clostridiales bacterium]